MNQLTDEEKHVIIDKGMELPYSGALLDENRQGDYSRALIDTSIVAKTITPNTRNTPA